MKSIELKGAARESLGKKGSKTIRANEQVPCILYGGEKNIYFSVVERDLKPILYTPEVYLIKLNVDGKEYTAKIQDIQYHPVSDSPIHIDFLQVFEDKKLTIELPVKLNGSSIGVREGGKLTQELRKLKVKGFIKDLPDEINLDVTDLTIGKSLRVGDLTFKGFEVLNLKTNPVVSVRVTRASRGETAADGTPAAPGAPAAAAPAKA